ncbi:imelysin family protein [Pseudomonas sp. F1_0610]|uniref:imelysin family protein n=1 Tax=Pseudomonas sp. F1_0610 TaxID=3114284 RepID=UPI0039C0A2C8
MLKPSLLAVACLALVACSEAEKVDPQQQVTQALGEKVYQASYMQWWHNNRNLAASAQAFCDGKQDLAMARQVYEGAQQSWEAIQPLMIGAIAENNRAWQVQFWPDKKNLVARQVKQLMNRKPELTQADLEKASVVVQGLSAYEYLLYDKDIDFNNAAEKTKYCRLLTTIGTHQEILSKKVYDTWSTQGGILTDLSHYPNEQFAEPLEAITIMLQAQVTAIDTLKKKLGAPMGRQLKQPTPVPFQAEGWRSGLSLKNMQSTIESAQKVWQGVNDTGIRKLVAEQDPKVAETIDKAYADALANLAGFDKPLTELVVDKSQAADLEKLYKSFDALHRLHEREVAQVLGVQLGFNANDGD